MFLPKITSDRKMFLSKNTYDRKMFLSKNTSDRKIYLFPAGVHTACLICCHPYGVPRAPAASERRNIP